MKSWLKTALVLLVLAACPAFAFDGVTANDPLFGVQNQVFHVVDQQWRVNELLLKAQTNSSDLAALEAYEKEADLLSKNENALGKTISQALSNNDTKTLDLVGSIYRSLGIGARNAIFPALQTARAEAAGDAVAMTRMGDYFPGYGYPEPGYKYRRGLEVSREDKGTTWQYEEHTISTSKSIKLTVTIDVLGILKSLLHLGKIGDLVVGREYNSYYNGAPMIVVDVTFSTAQTIFTKANRKYEVNKVWFELQRSSDAGWHNAGTWETVGKTYQIMMDPTGEAVTTEVHDTPVPTPAPTIPTPAPTPTVPFAN